MPAEQLAVRSPSLHRIPSLDGLRAISIFLVVAVHSVQRVNASGPVSRLWYAIFDGGTGVYIFFVISGFLITSLLLVEREKKGSINLSSFYVRRAFRILPPLYFYVAVVVLLGLSGRLTLHKQDIYAALFFFHNYILGTMWSLEHFWSLSVEEQFYFLWPIVLIACLRRPGLPGRYAAAKVALWVIALSPVLRVGFVHFRVPGMHNGGNFHLKADSVMFGCAVALLQGTPTFERFYRLATRVWWIPPMTIVVSDCLDARFQNYYSFPIGDTITGLAIAVFLLWCVRNSTTRLGRFLNWGPIRHIGVLSYSIYLWQTLFLHPLNGSIFGSLFSALPRAISLPLSWLAILLAAEFSYHVVEQPSLRGRNLLMARFRRKLPAGPVLT